MRWWMCVMENEEKKKLVSEEVLNNKLRNGYDIREET